MIEHKKHSIEDESKKKSNAQLTEAVNDTNSAVLTSWTSLMDAQIAMMELANTVAALQTQVVELTEQLVTMGGDSDG